MKVKATQPGFLDCLRETDDEFEIEEDQFSEVWMEKVTGKRGRPKKVEEAPAEEPEEA